MDEDRKGWDSLREDDWGYPHLTRTDYGNSANDGATTGVIDLATGVNDRALRWDQESATPYKPAGLVCMSGKVSITGAATPGKFIKALYWERGKVDKGPDVSA